MFSILLILLPSQSSGQSRCGEFTTNDVEGPFFEVCEFLINSQKKLCTAKRPKKLCTGPAQRAQRSQPGSSTERTGPVVKNVRNVTKYGKLQLKIKVLDSNCKGIGGALVEVWYAGGDPGFPKSLSTDGSPPHLILSILGHDCMI